MSRFFDHVALIGRKAVPRGPTVCDPGNHKDRLVDTLDLSVRARRSLARSEIDTVEQLVQRTEADLLALTRFGATSTNEVKHLLRSMGLQLAQPGPKWPFPEQEAKVRSLRSTVEGTSLLLESPSGALADVQAGDVRLMPAEAPLAVAADLATRRLDALAQKIRESPPEVLDALALVANAAASRAAKATPHGVEPDEAAARAGRAAADAVRGALEGFSPHGPLAASVQAIAGTIRTAPGGGAAGAMALALAAATARKALGLSKGRGRLSDGALGDLDRTLPAADGLLDLAAQDHVAWNGLVAARSLPVGSPIRQEKVRQAMAQAAKVQAVLGCMAKEVASVAAVLAEEGNPRVLPDALLAAVLADAVATGARAMVDADGGDGPAAAARQAVTDHAATRAKVATWKDDWGREPLKDDFHLRCLQRRIDDLEAAIRAHRDAKGHGRCWENDLALYRTLGETLPEPSMPPRGEFMGRCAAYYAQQTTGAKAGPGVADHLRQAKDALTTTLPDMDGDWSSILLERIKDSAHAVDQALALLDEPSA